jgi:hypothetical protein
MCPDVPYFIILLCLMPDDFTCQGESAASQWVTLLGALGAMQLIPIEWQHSPPDE